MGVLIWEVLKPIVIILIVAFVIFIILAIIAGAVKGAVKEKVERSVAEEHDAFIKTVESSYTDTFNPTETVDGLPGHNIRYMEVDTKNKKWRINWTTDKATPIYEYRDLRDFEFIENSQGSTTKSTTHTKATTAPAGILFTDTIKKTYATHETRIEHTDYVSMKIRISFMDLTLQDQYISFPSVGVGGSGHKQVLEMKEGCMSLLRKIKAFNEENSDDTDRGVSVADELFKLKALLDAGVITQEEFDDQKHKLL